MWRWQVNQTFLTELRRALKSAQPLVARLLQIIDCLRNYQGIVVLVINFFGFFCGKEPLLQTTSQGDLACSLGNSDHLFQFLRGLRIESELFHGSWGRNQNVIVLVSSVNHLCIVVRYLLQLRGLIAREAKVSDQNQQSEAFCVRYCHVASHVLFGLLLVGLFARF